MSYPGLFAKAKEVFSVGTHFLKEERFRIGYVFLFYLAFFSLIYLTIARTFGLDDQFFHIRFAELFREQGMAAFTDFQSIYFSRMGIEQEYFVYYNFLFYLILIPFTLITPLVIGMKLYGVVVLSFSFTTVYVFLHKIAVRYPFLWTLLLLTVLMQSQWLYRFTIARPFTLAPVFLIILLFFIHRKKHGWSAITAFLFFYWHTATFFFPLALAGAYFLFEQFYGKKPDWRMVYMPLFGTLLAVSVAYFISPGVVAYLRDVIFPVFFDTVLTKGTGIVEGAEVYGRNILITIPAFFWLVTGLFVMGSYEVLRYIRTKRGIATKEEAIDLSIQPLRAVLFTASLFFLAATVLSVRFLDYFVYFSLIYVAIAVTDAVQFIRIHGTTFRKSLAFGAAVTACYLFINLAFGFYDSLAEAKTQVVVQAPAEWLNANVKEEKIIFNVDWSAFPALYYFTGDRFRYATGLEPRFLYDLSPEMYWMWNNMGNHGILCVERDCSQVLERKKQALSRKESEQGWYEEQGAAIAAAVQDVFKTDIIVVSIERKDLLAVMDHSDRFKKEYFDDTNSALAVYRIVESGERESKESD